MSRAFILIFCGLLTTTTAVSVDLFLPLLGNITRDFNAPPALIQLTLPSFTFAMGISQFFSGNLSDRFGRKAVLCAGLGLFLVASLLCIFAPNPETLIAARALQGLGAGCGSILGRTILRDLYSGRDLSVALAWSTAIFASGPIIAPLLGSFLVEHFDWRVASGSWVLIGSAMLLVGILKLEETNQHKNPHALTPQFLWTAACDILTTRQSAYFIVLIMVNYVAIIAYLSNATLALENRLAMGAVELGWFYALTAIGIVVGQIANARAIPRWGELTCMRVAICIMLSCSLSISLIAHSSLSIFWAAAGISLVVFSFHTSFSVVFSNAISIVVGRHPRIAGFATGTSAALAGLLPPLLVAATLTSIAGNLVYLGLLMALSCLGSLVLLFSWRKPIERR